MAILNVRVDARTLERIEQLASRSARSRSAVAREALERLVDTDGADTMAPSLAMAHLIGCWDGPSAGLSERTGDRFAQAVRRSRQR